MKKHTPEGLFAVLLICLGLGWAVGTILGVIIVWVLLSVCLSPWWWALPVPVALAGWIVMRVISKHMDI